VTLASIGTVYAAISANEFTLFLSDRDSYSRTYLSHFIYVRQNSCFFIAFQQLLCKHGLIDFRYHIAFTSRNNRTVRRGWWAWRSIYGLLRTSASSSLEPPECHPGDGPGMKPIFDGVYINQILFRAGIVSGATLAPDMFSPSYPGVRPGLPASFDRRLTERPFKTELKRGSIFIRRFLMKHFKCMESTVVRLAALALVTVPLTQSPSSLPISVTPRPRYLPHA